MSDWFITESRDGDYVLHWREEEYAIAGTDTPMGIVVDAVCDFLDRKREKNVPSFVTCDEDLMLMCVRSSWKQK